MVGALERFERFLNNSPLAIRFPIKLFLTFVLGIGFVGWSTNKLVTKGIAILGTLCVLLSILGFIFWIFGSGASIWNILELYGIGQALKFVAWIPRARISKGKKKSQASAP